MNPKREAQICHTVTVLMALLADYTDELNELKPLSKRFKDKVEDLLPLCEELITKVYGFPEISSSTYLSSLSNKIDSIIRHNYERII